MAAAVRLPREAGADAGLERFFERATAVALLEDVAVVLLFVSADSSPARSFVAASDWLVATAETSLVPPALVSCDAFTAARFLTNPNPNQIAQITRTA